jgi:hypothetical protein
MRFWPAAFAALLAATGAQAETFTETFDGGSNTGGWTFFAPNEVIETTGGNPGAYLHGWTLDTFAPQPRTTEPSVFTGDLRALGVTSIGVDVIVHDVDFTAEGRPLALMLYTDNDTPRNYDDDRAAKVLGPEIPNEGEGWASFDFDVPSQETSLPAGWGTVPFGPDANPDWNAVITEVDQVGFFFGDPTGFFIFQNWDVGLDNPRITYAAPTPARDASWGRVKTLYR